MIKMRLANEPESVEANPVVELPIEAPKEYVYNPDKLSELFKPTCIRYLLDHASEILRIKKGLELKLSDRCLLDISAYLVSHFDRSIRTALERSDFDNPEDMATDCYVDLREDTINEIYLKERIEAASGLRQGERKADVYRAAVYVFDKLFYYSIEGLFGRDFDLDDSRVALNKMFYAVVKQGYKI